MARASAHSGTRTAPDPSAGEADREAEAIAAGERTALRLTEDVQQRIERLETLLRTSLTRDPRVEIASLRSRPVMPPLDPVLPPAPPPVPAFRHFIPAPPPTTPGSPC